MNAYSAKYKTYSFGDTLVTIIMARTPEKAIDALRKAMRRKSSSLIFLSIELVHTDVVVA